MTVDFGAPVAGLNPATGLIHGLNLTTPATAPPSNLISPLDLNLWRIGSQASIYYDRMTGFGARHEFVTSDVFGYPKGSNTISLPGNGGSWTAYDEFVQTQATQALQNQRTMVWEFWNEPDLTFRDQKVNAAWPGTKPQFYEAYKHFYQGLRAILPNAQIGGPTPSNYDAAFLGEFLDACKANNVQVNVLTWHEFPADVREIPAHVEFIRNNYVNNPAYAALNIQEIHINEFLGGGNDQYRAGALLSYLYNFEDARANPKGVCKSCWSTLDGTGSNCFNGTLGGMLTPGATQQPRALWWAAKAYADGVGARVSSTASDGHFLPFASSATAQGTNRAQVLIGYYDLFNAYSPAAANVRLRLDRLTSLGFLSTASAVHVNVQKIPDTLEAAVPALATVAEVDLPIAAGTATLTLPAIALHEAWVVTLSASTAAIPAVPTATAPPAATPAADRIALSWSAIAGATSYTLFRSAAPGAVPAVEYSGLTSTSFADLNVTPAQTYYYKLAAVNSAGAGPRSAEVSAPVPPAPTTTPGPPPAPWTAGDVGPPLVAGSTTYSAGVFTVQGAGADIFGGFDEFQFVRQPLTGDGQIVARVDGILNTHPWAKAGLMMRQSLNASAPYAMMALSKSNGTLFQWKAPDNTGGYKVGAWPGTSAWLKLTRVGNVFSGYMSPDGVSWTLLQTATFSTVQTVWVGLALTSHNKALLTTSRFDNVSINGVTEPPPPPPPSSWTSTDIGAPSPAGSASANGGVFTVNGAGADIWGTFDQFQFYRQALTGDGQIVARVTGVGNTDPWAKAGVMLRQSVAGGAVNALMALSRGNGAVFQSRSADSGPSSYTPRSWAAAPCWVKLVRLGNNFTGSVSADGIAWTAVASAAIPMTAAIEAGLAVTSHNPGALNTATFDNLSVTAYAPIQSWRAQNGLPFDGSGEGADEVDIDGDGLGNLLEYAVMLPPRIAGIAGAPSVSGASGRLAITFPRNPAFTDISYIVEAGSALNASALTSIAKSTAGGAMTNLGGAFSIIELGSTLRTVTVEDSVLLTGGGQRFIRLKITRP